MQRLIAVLACLLCTTAVHAEIRRFPYEAVVKTDDVAVRSGPGKNFYATSQLEKNAVVVVHRHDPGGWYMIAPPTGSFSWIRADQVRVEAAGTGVIDLTAEGTEGAPVWVGSEVEEAHSVRGRVLAHGDSVEILGEEEWTTNTGTIAMLRIAPTAREYRWVKGDFVVPRDANLRQEVLADPYANPLATTEPTDEEPVMVKAAAAPPADEPLPALARQPRQTAEVTDSDTLVTETEVAPRSAGPNDARAALREIDRRYTAMIELDPAQWDIDELIRSYKGLAATAPQLAKSIEQRVTALEDRRQLSEEYRSFVQLTSQTNERDQQLASQGQITVAEMITAVDLGEPSPIDGDLAVPSAPTLEPTLGSPAEIEPTPVPSIAGPVLPAPTTPQLAAPSTASAPIAATAPATETVFVGAGIVRKLSANGQPTRYGLVSPQGRVLAVLEAVQPADLERVVGQAMGFAGDRKFDQQLGTDLLKITRMSPVQLQTR